MSSCRVGRVAEQAIDLAGVGEEPLLYAPRKLSCGRVSGWLCRCGVSLARSCTPLDWTPAVWARLSYWLHGIEADTLRLKRCLMLRDFLLNSEDWAEADEESLGWKKPFLKIHETNV